jgi:lipoprotein-releasing system permease protein
VPFELFLALRYLLAQRRQAFISVISLVSVLGVAVGVAALIIALGLMTGLQRELRDRILGSTAHIYLWQQGGLEDYRSVVQRALEVDGVVGAAPLISDVGLIYNPGITHALMTVKGVDPNLEPTVTDIQDAMITGSLGALQGQSDDLPPGIVLGKDLAEKLGVSVGDRVYLFTAGGGSWSLTGMLPRQRPARVVGTYSLGLYEYDSAYGFVSLEFAARLTGQDEPHPQQIQVRVSQIDDAPRIARRIESSLGPGFVTEDWQRTNQPLFSALWLEKMGLSIAVGLIVAVAALNIVASLVLLVMEKSRDIAILKTMGLSPARVRRTFMLQGLIIGLVGTTVGATGGLALCWFLDTYQVIRLSDVYQAGTYVRFVVMPFDFLVVIASAVVICFVATIYPSRQAARLDPVQALRFE